MTAVFVKGRDIWYDPEKKILYTSWLVREIDRDRVRDLQCACGIKDSLSWFRPGAVLTTSALWLRDSCTVIPDRLQKCPLSYYASESRPLFRSMTSMANLEVEARTINGKSEAQPQI